MTNSTNSGIGNAMVRGSAHIGVLFVLVPVTFLLVSLLGAAMVIAAIPNMICRYAPPLIEGLLKMMGQSERSTRLAKAPPPHA
jgi:hypothetical protein